MKICTFPFPLHVSHVAHTQPCSFLNRELLSCLPPSANNTNGRLAMGRLGGCDRRKAGHSQGSIGSAVLLLEGREIITGPETAIHSNEDHKESELFIHEMELLNHICTKLEPRTETQYQCNIKALWACANTKGALTEGCKRVKTDLHDAVTLEPYPQLCPALTLCRLITSDAFHLSERS